MNQTTRLEILLDKLKYRRHEMHLHVHRSEASGNWYVRLVGGNGEVMMFSEFYHDKSNAVRAAENIQNEWILPIEVRVDGNDD